MNILTIEKDGVFEEAINKSKFIAYSFALKNFEQIEQNLNMLQKKYSDATHICYAYKFWAVKRQLTMANHRAQLANQFWNASKSKIIQMFWLLLSDILVALNLVQVDSQEHTEIRLKKFWHNQGKSKCLNAKKYLSNCQFLKTKKYHFCQTFKIFLI